MSLSQAPIYVTGTDTGVGKTVLTVLLTRRLRERGIQVRAVKPFCSGGRADAMALRRAQDNTVTLDEINPWSFRAPLAPLLAARHEQRVVPLAAALDYLRTMRGACDVLIIEGAGGLLSPLGDGFSNLELIAALRAAPVVVAPNRLGAVNQVRLGLAALPRRLAPRAKVVLVDPPRANLASRTNAALLRELCGPERIFTFPWLGKRPQLAGLGLRPSVRKVLDALWTHPGRSTR